MCGTYFTLNGNLSHERGGDLFQPIYKYISAGTMLAPYGLSSIYNFGFTSENFITFFVRAHSQQPWKHL